MSLTYTALNMTTFTEKVSGWTFDKRTDYTRFTGGPGFLMTWHKDGLRLAVNFDGNGALIWASFTTDGKLLDYVETWPGLFLSINHYNGKEVTA